MLQAAGNSNLKSGFRPYFISIGKTCGEYFGWTDAQRDNSRELAERFMQRFPKLVSMGNGRDWTYSGWYVSVLGVAETGHLPIAYGDPKIDPRKGVIGTISLSGKDLYLQPAPLR